MRPIHGSDIFRVSHFLHLNMNGRPGVDAWRRLMEQEWSIAAPNHGFQLMAGSDVVGAYLAIYSDREKKGETYKFCNLAAFCVLPEYRHHAMRLYRALLAQKGYEFTDLSPSGNVIALNERLGFKRLDLAASLVPNYPWIGRRRVGLTERPEILREVLGGTDLKIFEDHAGCPASRHLLISSGSSYAYVLYRRDRRKHLPVFASPLYAGGSLELLQLSWPEVAGFLLTRHGMLATLAERRILGFTPKGGYSLDSPRPKMYRSARLAAKDIDYLYSELTVLEW